MAIKASVNVIAEMRADIQRAINEIMQISEHMNTAGRITSGWEDEQSQQYSTLMGDAAKVARTPVDTLKAAIPKLQKLEQAIQNYSSVKFNG
jgi:methionyl-tRNA synthetase